MSARAEPAARRARPAAAGRILAAAALVAATWCGGLAGQESTPAPGRAPDPAAERRARFERMLVAPDAEAERLVESLAHEPPEVLAALANVPRARSGPTAIVRAEGWDPPLACVVVLPAAPPPPGGYPTYATVTGPVVGPEEFDLRARFAPLLAAGAAILAPVETTLWLKNPTPAAEIAGRSSWRFAPLFAAAERILPLDPSRRILLLGDPVCRLIGIETRGATTAFSAVHWTCPGDLGPLTEDDLIAYGPRRLVYHHGPRLWQPARFELADLARRGKAAGVDVRVLEDPRLEHAPLARFAGPAAVAALDGLPPNRLPARAAAECDPEFPAGGAGVVLGASGGKAAFVVDGLGTATPTLRIDRLDVERALVLELPTGAGEAVDWTSPAAWGRVAPTPEVATTGATAQTLPPDRARERLWAYRLARLSGTPITSVVRVRVTPKP